MTTERRNPRSVDIDLFPTERMLRLINAEDATVANAVASAISEIAKTVDNAVETIRSGGRMLYVGAGTSGRIALLDAAECPPTFSAPAEWVQAVIAGGSKAVTQPGESAEDNREKAATDLKAKKLKAKDLVIGIAASGKTPYTWAALEYAHEKGAKTVAVVSTPDSPMSKVADVSIYVPVGPEVDDQRQHDKQQAEGSRDSDPSRGPRSQPRRSGAVVGGIRRKTETCRDHGNTAMHPLRSRKAAGGWRWESA
jgi:N-acetylmuramic acid 6-phosphate etherase